MPYLLIGLLLISSCFASNSTTECLTFDIGDTRTLTVSAHALTLSIPFLIGGSGSVTDTSSTYSIVGSPAAETLRITAAIDLPMPPFSSLQSTLDSNIGTSLGSISLSTLPQTVVSGIDATFGFSSSNQRIQLLFSVIAGYADSAAFTRTITYTLTL